MIFVILGSQKFQFNRLIKYMDDLVKEGIITEKIVVQTGFSEYVSEGIYAIPFIQKNEFNEYIEKASLIITHGGTGAIVGSLKKGKKIIAVPRNSKYNEHIDNHQYEIINIFKKQGYILSAESKEELIENIQRINLFIPKTFESNTHNYIEFITNQCT